MKTHKRRMRRGTIPKERYVETAKVLLKAFKLRKSFGKYSVNVMALQIFCERREDGSGNKFYIEQSYNSF
jgi:hypothetical protein